MGRRIELASNHKGVSVVESHSRRADDGTAPFHNSVLYFEALDAADAAAPRRRWWRRS